MFFLTEDEKEQFMMQLSNVQLQEIQKDADRICKRFFRILGSGICDVGEKLPWHIDFKVGYEWKSQYYKKIKKIDLYNDADVKIPWELSRCYHFLRWEKHIGLHKITNM